METNTNFEEFGLNNQGELDLMTAVRDQGGSEADFDELLAQQRSVVTTDTTAVETPEGVAVQETAEFKPAGEKFGEFAREVGKPFLAPKVFEAGKEFVSGVGEKKEEIEKTAIEKQQERFEEGAPVGQTLRGIQEVGAPVSAISRELGETFIEEPVATITGGLDVAGEKLFQLITGKSDEEMVEANEKRRLLKEGAAEKVTGDIEQARQENEVFDKTLKFLGDLGAAAEPILNLLGLGAISKPAIKEIGKIELPSFKTAPKEVSAVRKKIAKDTESIFRLDAKTSQSSKTVEKFRNQTSDALSSINKRKESLEFDRDLATGPVRGQNPSNLVETAEAYSKVKNDIYADIEREVAKAGGAGLKTDLTKGIDDFVNNLATSKDKDLLKLKNTLDGNKDFRDGFFAKIEEIKQKFGEKGVATIPQTEANIELFNKELKGFYEGKEAKSVKSQGDAFATSIAARLARQDIDNQINGLTGGNFQALKNEYGSLAATQKALMKSVARQQNKVPGSLSNFFDSFAVGELLAGSLTGNLGQMIRGGVSAAGKTFLEFKGSPDNLLKKAFKELEKQAPIKEVPRLD